MNWIKEGLKKEWESLHDFRTWMMVSAIVGIPYVINIFIPFNTRVLGVIYLCFAVFIFVLTYRINKKSNHEQETASRVLPNISSEARPAKRRKR